MDFDAFGHLTPSAVLETSLADFEAVLVTGVPESLTRRRIFERYVAERRRIVGSGFVQWVDGSFVTRKVNPGDVDFVTFFGAEVYERHEQRIEGLRQRRYLPGCLAEWVFCERLPRRAPV